MKLNRAWLLSVALAALGAASGVQAQNAPDVVVLGTDYLMTAPGAQYTLDGVTVDFRGLPIGPGLTDTIVQRTSDIVIGATNTAPNLQIVALSLVSTNFAIPLYVSLDPTLLARDTGVMSIYGSLAGGTFTTTNFNAYFDVCAYTFCNGSNLVAQGSIDLSGAGNWGPTPPTGAVEVLGLVGDQWANIHTNLNSNESDFWIVGVLNHTGPHPVQVALVPEPGAWAMMLLGFGGIGFAARRRSRQRGAAGPTPATA